MALGWLINDLATSWWANQEQTKYIWDMALFIVFVILLTLIGGLIPKALVLNRTEKAALNLAPNLELVIKIIGNK